MQRWTILLLWGWCTTCFGATVPTGEFVEVQIKSSIDSTSQPCRVYIPKADDARPVLVFLHSWSSGLEQDNTRWLVLAKQRNWIFLQPDFRGKNLRPEACGSDLARQDILDAVQWAFNETSVDRSRIYLAGTSGGGHMAMLMAGYYPDKFSAVSAWVGISDIAKWHAFTSKYPQHSRYAREIEICLGGKPGSSDKVIEENRKRSPFFHLAKAKDVPLDINTGVHDGHTGSVPVSNSFEAFNAILQAKGQPLITDEVIQNWLNAGADPTPRKAVVEDASYSRAVLFRANSGVSRLTVFEGGHEDLPHAGIQFMEAIQRPTTWTSSR